MGEHDDSDKSTTRVDRNHSSKRSSRRSRKSRGGRKWLKSPFLWLGLLVVLALAAGGAFFALNSRGDSGSASDNGLAAADSGSSTDATAGSGSSTDATATTGEVPLASSTRQIVAEMSLEEKIGQMIMIGFEGYEPSRQVTSAIQEKHIGSLIIFGRNINSKEQVAAMDASLQALAAQAKQPAKLMIAIDQEGGSTRRFTDIGPFYSEPMIGEMGSEAGAAAAQQQASSAARDLKKLGINTNLAPVVDVSDGWGSIMDGRSYGADSELVTELGGMAVRGYNNATTISCPKHFPGHGSADGDSETTLPTVDLSLEAIQQSELLPFQQVIKEGAPMIMVAHLRCRRWTRREPPRHFPSR